MIDRDRAIAEAAGRYAPIGRFAERAARGKLRLDPIYAALLDRGLSQANRVVDLGCGRGFMLALILVARDGGAAAPGLHGVERSAAAVRQARGALGAHATIVEADLSVAPIPAADAILLLDVLHYLDRATQDTLLDRACASLLPGGHVFVREADASAGLRFLAVRASERLMATARGDLAQRFHYRTASEWGDALAARGLAFEFEPMGAGTPFANVLFVGRLSGQMRA